MNSQRTVLAVDDNAMNLDVIREILSTGYTLHCASSGEEALRVAQAVRPDVVLLDIMMPGIDGYETCRQMRSDPVLQAAKIILVSAKAMVEERLRGYEAGADDYLAKPYEPAELEAKVKVFARLKRVEELDKMKSDLLVLINHETRTPLATMFGALELIQKDTSKRAENLQQLCALAVDSMSRLRDLLEQSQLLCAFRGDSVAFGCEPLDVPAVLVEVVGKARKRANRPEVDVIVSTAHDLPILADAKYLPMALQFLLEYAIQHCSPGESVTVTAVPSRGNVEFQVAYRGPGLSADRIACLFEPLQSPDIDHHTRGTGLGLAITREVARRHSGDVAAFSVPDLETRLSLRLPVTGMGTTGASADPVERDARGSGSEEDSQAA
jgi:CheY-like chemotaxis protein